MDIGINWRPACLKVHSLPFNSIIRYVRDESVIFAATGSTSLIYAVPNLQVSPDVDSRASIVPALEPAGWNE